MKKLIGGFLAAFFIAGTPAYAVSTSAVACGTTDWADAGTGPFTIQMTNVRALVAIADSKPSDKTIGFHFSQMSFPFAYAGSSHFWCIGLGYAIIAK